MSENAPELSDSQRFANAFSEDGAPQEPTTPVEETGQTETSVTHNPAWEPFLKDIPTVLHPTVTKHLAEWDKGVNDRFQQVHSQYDPWKAVIDAAGTPESAQDAIQLLQAINTNPKAVWEALAEYNGYNTAEQGRAEQQQPVVDPNAEYVDPRITELEQGFRTLAELTLAERQAAANAQADYQLDADLKQLSEKFGPYDETFVLSQMQAGLSGEQAVQKYNEIIDAAKSAQSRPSAQAPVVMSSGGGLPSNAIDFGSLDSKGTKNLVQEMLNAANRS